MAQDIISDVFLRPAKVEDAVFINDLVRRVMRRDVEIAWPNNLDRQEEYYQRAGFSNDRDERVIELFGSKIGRLATIIQRNCPLDPKDRLFFSQIQILPEYQELGLGTIFINQVIFRAREMGLPIVLGVFKSSNAVKLYEKFGFTKEVAIQNGKPADWVWRMVYRPRQFQLRRNYSIAFP